MCHYKKLLTLGITLLSAIGLAACSNSANGTNKHTHLSPTYEAYKSGTKAGNHSTLKVAEINNSPFTGVTAPTELSSEDQDVYGPGGEGSLYHTNNHYKVEKGGLADLKLSKKNNTATITLRKGAKWSNGMKVTAKDVEYPYEIIGNKNTKSQQFSDDMNDIKGMSAYHAGKANTISGITFPNGPKGRTTVIHFKRVTPAMKYAGNDFMWATVEPYEYLKNVPISKLQSSPQVRKHPIFVGPYKLEKQVTGESTYWEPNKDYFGKKPHIKHIEIQVVNNSNYAASLRSKKYDFAFNAPAEQYPQVKGLKDYTEVGFPTLGYSLLGFDTGHMNNSNRSIMDKNAKMANPDLRKAMIHALNFKLVAKKFGYGLSYRANTLIPPIFGKYHASYASDPGLTYNMSKANQLIKDAGYKKQGKWLYKNGHKLIVHFGAQNTTSSAKAVDQYFLQQWRKLGIDASFTNGRPQETNNFYSTLQKPKQHSMDVFEYNLGLNSEPTPTAAFGPEATFNFGHLVTKKNSKLLNELNSKKAFNLKYRIKIFKEWQKYMNKEAVYVPEFFSVNWTAVNHRVGGYNISPSNYNFWGKLSLNATSPK